MTQKIYGLTEEEHQAVKDWLAEGRRRPVNTPNRPLIPPNIESPTNTYIARAPLEGVPGRTGTHPPALGTGTGSGTGTGPNSLPPYENLPGQALCDIWRIVEGEPVTMILKTEFQLQVWNCTAKAFPGDAWLEINKDEYGYWIGQPLDGGSSTDELVKVSADETTADYLENKLTTPASVVKAEVSEGGNETLDVQLAGDQLSPGNTMLYGTNASGIKGWYAQPTGGGGVTDHALLTHLQWDVSAHVSDAPHKGMFAGFSASTGAATYFDVFGGTVTITGSWTFNNPVTINNTVTINNPVTINNKLTVVGLLVYEYAEEDVLYVVGHGTVNDFDPLTYGKVVFEVDNVAGLIITGIAGGVNGRILHVGSSELSIGSLALINASAGSVATNRLITPNTVNVDYGPGEGVELEWDIGNPSVPVNRWRFNDDYTYADGTTISLLNGQLSGLYSGIGAIHVSMSAVISVDTAAVSTAGIVSTTTQTFGGDKTTQVDNIGIAATAGLGTQNTTAATGVLQQYSPAFTQTAHGWNGSASQSVVYVQQCQPNGVTGVESYGFNINGAGYVEAARLYSTGQYVCTAAWLDTSDATGGVVDVLRLSHDSSAPADGIGNNIIFAASTTTTLDRQIARIKTTWSTSADASCVGRQDYLVSGHSGEQLIVRLESDGSTAKIGFLGATAVAQQTGDVGTGLVNLGLFGGTPTYAGANVTGTVPSATTAVTVTTNANLTGPITSVGNATSIASQTGTGTKFVVDTSPTLTGTPLAPTAAPGTNTTQIATTAFVQAAVTAGGGVTSLAGTALEVAVSGSTGAVTISLIGPHGFTTQTAHGVLLGQGTGTITATAAGAVNTVLHGAGSSSNPSFSAVVEADITLANNTTNDVSITKHGFAPIAPNDATKFLDGTGAYSVPSGTSITAAKAGISVVAGATVLNWTDANVENPSGTTADIYQDLPHICQGRLTLQSGVPVPSTDQTAATSFFWTPYKGKQVSIYDGTRWKKKAISEVQYLATANFLSGIHTTNGSPVITSFFGGGQVPVGMKASGTNIPANTTVISTTVNSITLSNNATGTSSAGSLTLKLPANTNYDVFLFPYGGAAVILLLSAWTSDTVRANALGTQDGVDVNNAAMSGTNDDAIPAKQGRYVGTIRTTATDGQLEDSAGGSVSQSGGFRGVWNRYNQEPRDLFVKDTTDTWAYALSALRLANGASVPSNCVRFVLGDAAAVVQAELKQSVALNGGGANRAIAAIGLDSTSAFSGTAQSGYNSGATTVISAVGAHYKGRPGIGYHYMSQLEAGIPAIAVCSFTGDDGGDCQSGLHVWLMG